MHQLTRIIAAALFAGAALAALPALSEAPERTVKVWKSPTCGCCNGWIDHLRAAGFKVEALDVTDVTLMKRENGIPGRFTSCHTALVGGYFVEGHVPAADVERLLAERPPIAGLAVPGMPIGSPGMEGPKPQRYDVLALDGDGGVSVFATHGP